MNDYDIYRRIMASSEPVETCIWYLGHIFALPDGYPPILTMQVEAVMVYRAETISDDRFRIRWTEIGVFRDAITGETTGTWRNPITGEDVTLPSTFSEGPGEYIVDRTDTGLALTLHQPNATIETLDVRLTRNGNRILLDQNEHKVRGMLASGKMSKTHTRLFLGVDFDEHAQSFRGEGAYRSATDSMVGFGGFDGFPGGTVTQGPMRKTTTDDPVNAGAWARLKEHHSGWFDSDGLKAKWPD